MAEKELKVQQLDPEIEAILKAQFQAQFNRFKGFHVAPVIRAQHGVKSPGFEIEGIEGTIKDLHAVILQCMEMAEYREDSAADGATAPTCQSTGCKWGTKYGECSSCGFGKWQEDSKGKPFRPCHKYYKLILVVKGSTSPYYEMKVSGASNAAFRDYFKETVVSRQMPLSMAVTKISLSAKTEGKQTFSTFNFEFEHKISEEADKDFMSKIVNGLKTGTGLLIETTEADSSKAAPVAAAEVVDISPTETIGGSFTEDSDEVPF